MELLRGEGGAGQWRHLVCSFVSSCQWWPSLWHEFKGCAMNAKEALDWSANAGLLPW